jgi:Uncharacterised nucleotidyltransferase
MSSSEPEAAAPPGGLEPRPEELMAGARRLILDAATAQAVTAMRARGLRPILIKGPAIQSRFYPDGVRRRYDDVDLLVAPAEFDAAGAVLIELRYRMALPERWLGVRMTETPMHAVEFIRQGRVTVAIDLHRSIHWPKVDPDRVWSELSRATEQMTVGGAEVEVLGGAAQAVVVALHAVQHGHHPKPLEDLRHALDALQPSTWSEAAQIAGRLDAAEPFAAGLRMLPAGAAVAERLELTDSESAEVRLLRDGDALIALALEQFLTERSWRRRARLAWAKLLPSPDYVRLGYPIARTGTLGLIRGYGQRALALAQQTPAALAAWRNARRRR